MNENQREALQLAEAVLSRAIDDAAREGVANRVELELHEARGIVDLLRKLLGAS